MIGKPFHKAKSQKHFLHSISSQNNNVVQYKTSTGFIETMKMITGRRCKNEDNRCFHIFWVQIVTVVRLCHQAEKHSESTTCPQRKET